MGSPRFGPDQQKTVENILGYLNFGSGTSDPLFLTSLNQLFGFIESSISDAGDAEVSPGWKVVGQVLRDELARLQTESSAFRDSTQATDVLRLVWDHFLPQYRDHHRDLLQHQTDSYLYRPFFVGRAMEAVLARVSKGSDDHQITHAVIKQLNDFVGHRPVATLENVVHEPYVHEWVRPIPLYLRSVGVAVGQYQALIEQALQMLTDTDEDMLRRAQFDPSRMQELAVDPRGCDFDHPAGKRPNYQFGQWDPHQIDPQGYYSRFVLQQVTLDSLLNRLTNTDDLPVEEIISEAAAVLAGTILMASGISGNGPDAHDSTVTLSNLLPRIARYRDEFYKRLLNGMKGTHAERLRGDSSMLRQPFGTARQHLNAQLAHRRATQTENICLAGIFARMGNPQAAMRQADAALTVSGRMRCQVDCWLLAVDAAIDDQKLSEAGDQLLDTVAYVQRAIQCGAVVDPWNILGFDAQYSLFPALENSVRDTRADDLIHLMDRIFTAYERLWSEAAACDQPEVSERVPDRYRKLAEWWHQFAVHEVSSVDGFHALDAYSAAERAASALGLWHKGGASAGDVRFWAPHAQMFDSPKAYARVIRALLDHGDLIASLSLLVHWISQAERITLVEGKSSFFELARRWLRDVQYQDGGAENDRIWPQVQKFFDYLEANADEYWQAPEWELGQIAPRADRQDEALESSEEVDDEDGESSLYSAAYEDVVYRDSTDDGIEGELFGSDVAENDEWEHESRRILGRLTFLENLAGLWKTAAMGCATHKENVQYRETLQSWFEQCLAYQRGLRDLLQTLTRQPVPRPLELQQSIMDFDRRRSIKEAMLDRIVATCVEISDAGRMVLAVVLVHDSASSGETPPAYAHQLDSLEWKVVQVTSAVLAGDAVRIDGNWRGLIDELIQRPLLYVPLARGGDPISVVETRTRQRMIELLLTWLPRLGCLAETCELIDVARNIERNQSVGPAAVTEFDSLFETGFRALIESIIASTRCWRSVDLESDMLVDCLEQLTQMLLGSWLSHSRTLRLSVLEKVADQKKWKSLVNFVERYGADIFTQQFLNLANLRAVLHKGVEDWLQQMEDSLDDVELPRLISELGQNVTRREAVEHVTLALESILENYSAYRDYNSTTTQSDRGDKLHSLLDFLRLRTEYDRVAWNLKPVILAHEILIRRSRSEDAELWRRALVERTDDHAQRFLQRLVQLQMKYAMQIPTLTDRLSERFVRPMAIDRIRALVKPAMREMNAPGPHTAFDLLEQEASALAHEASGAGLDVPTWIIALQEEVETARRRDDYAEESELDRRLPQVPLPADEIQRQLDECEKRREADGE